MAIGLIMAREFYGVVKAGLEIREGRCVESQGRADGLLQFKFAARYVKGLIRDVAIFDSGREPRGEPGGDGEWDARGGGRGAGVHR